MFNFFNWLFLTFHTWTFSSTYVQVPLKNRFACEMARDGRFHELLRKRRERRRRLDALSNLLLSAAILKTREPRVFVFVDYLTNFLNCQSASRSSLASSSFSLSLPAQRSLSPSDRSSRLRERGEWLLRKVWNSCAKKIARTPIR